MLILDKNIGESTISLEQTHFCMYHTYSIEELNHFMFGLYQRIHVYRFSIENLLEKEMSIQDAVENARLQMKEDTV